MNEDDQRLKLSCEHILSGHRPRRPDDWLRDLAAWTSKNDNVDEMWSFGSRADGTGKPQRDVRISLASLHQLVCGKITTGHSAISVP